MAGAANIPVPAPRAAASASFAAWMDSAAAPPRLDDGRVDAMGLAPRDLQALLVHMGEKPFRGRQISQWIHRRRARRFEAMTDLGKDLRSRLAEAATVRTPEIVGDQVSVDGTRKWMLRVDGGNCIEMVFIPDGERGTLCVSSQVGCALNCSFCATARQGFNRNLSAAEIIGQLWLAHDSLGTAGPDERVITNVVLMGMGEPLLNVDNVVPALELMLDDHAYGMARKRVTLSTAGLVPGIRRLKDRCPVSLAVSLHAPDDELRDELVPINRTYPIDELLAACRDYVEGDDRGRITFEYVMLDGVNDSDGHARRLAKRLHGMRAKVNLIPFNPFDECGYRRSPRPRIDRFRDILVAKDILTITRKTRGDDIDAACGQLAGRVVARSRRVRERRAGAAPARAES